MHQLLFKIKKLLGEIGSNCCLIKCCHFGFQLFRLLNQFSFKFFFKLFLFNIKLHFQLVKISRDICDIVPDFGVIWQRLIEWFDLLIDSCISALLLLLDAEINLGLQFLFKAEKVFDLLNASILEVFIDLFLKLLKFRFKLLSVWLQEIDLGRLAFHLRL